MIARFSEVLIHGKTMWFRHDSTGRMSIVFDSPLQLRLYRAIHRGHHPAEWIPNGWLGIEGLSSYEQSFFLEGFTTIG